MQQYTEQSIYDYAHRKIGYILTDNINGSQKAFSWMHKMLGEYDPKSNTTFDFYRHVVGYGNLLAGLVMQEENSKKK